MKQTYDEAMTYVYQDEGGYSNDAADPGGPTKYGITIHDARAYWKADATAMDVRNMPKSVAADIYAKHYADPLHYNDLPPGVDYSVLDYGINSGIGRSSNVYRMVTSKTLDPVEIINQMYDERLAFLKSLHTWSVFGKGWGDRCANGRKRSLALYAKYKDEFNNPKPTLGVEHGTAGGVIIVGGAAATQYPHMWYWIVGGTIVAAILTWTFIKLLVKGNKNV